MTRRATEQRPVVVGSSVGGFRIERIVQQKRGTSLRAEGSAADGTQVALRLVAAGRRDGDWSRRAAALAKVRSETRHPSLLPLHAGHDGGWLFVAMPMTPGVTLAERLERGPLDAAEALPLLDQIAAGLDAAAERGLVHRALAPTNIVLTDGMPQRALLTDFGVFVPDGRGCEVEATIAAAAYTPPEVVRGERRRPQSNVYALACVLAECLSAVRPFERGRPLLTLHAQLVEPPPCLSELKAGLPRGLDEVLATALAKDPDERFETAAGFVAAAQLALSPVPQPQLRPSPESQPQPDPEPHADPQPHPEPTPKPKRKREPRPRRERRRRRRTRGGLARVRTVPVVAASLLVIAASSGFALGSSHHGGGTPDRTRSHGAAASAPNAQAVRTVNAAMGRLVARRQAVLRVLEHARRSTTQAVGATLVAHAYRDAASELPSGLGSGLDLRQVSASLSATADAYLGLASAAEARDAARYDKARRAISAHESALQSAVKALAIAPSGSGYGSVKERSPGWQPQSSSLPRS